MLDEIIKKYRHKTDLCRSAGISPQYLNQIESGKRPIPPKFAKYLFQEHGIPLHVSRPDIYGDQDSGDAA